MNNKTPNRSEPRPDEHPFAHIISKTLLHQQNKRSNATPHRSAIPEYHITIEHGSIRIGQETDTGYGQPEREL